MTDQTPTTVIGGRYEIVRPIGHGGLGTVWLARDTVLGRQVAAKKIGHFPGESAGETHRAMREARAAAALNHPNVVAVYDVVEHDGSPWLVMEYVAGLTLATAIRQRGPMTPTGAADLGAQLAGALAAAHRAGIVHRDIKPANVLIGGGLPKLGDFGIARSGAEDHLTQTGLVTGTPSYMAPEVAVGGVHGPAADVWALGATIYFAVEGLDAHPAQGNALATLQHVAANPPRRPERAGPLEPILADLLSRDPERRGTMEQALQRLELVAAGGTGAAVPPGPARTATPRRSRTNGGSTPATSAMRPAGPAAPSPSRTKGGIPLRVWVALALVAALLVLAIVFALSRGGAGAAATGTSGSAAASASPSDEAEPAGGQTGAPETEPTDSGESSDLALTRNEGKQFIEDYFAAVTEDRDASWAMLAPARQGDPEGYEDFWSGIDSAETEDVVVDSEAGTVSVTLTLEPEDGDAVTKRYTYQLTRIGGDLKIDAND